MTHTSSKRVAIFDWGSGKLKCDLFDIHLNTTPQTFRKIDSVFRWVKLADALKKNTHGEFDSEIQKYAEDQLKDLLFYANSKGATTYFGVATEAFRNAKNGESFLKKMQEKFKISFQMVTQNAEADLAFNTALFLTKTSPDKLVVVDHGSGSFQISGQNALPYKGKLGAIALTELLINIQGKEYQPGSSPGPVSNLELVTFITEVQKALSQSPIPFWLKDKLKCSDICVAGLGDTTGTMGMCAHITGKTIFTQQELKNGTLKLLNLSFKEIQKDFQQIADQTMLPRIFFIYALMIFMKIEKITWVKSNGNGEGILLSRISEL